MSVSNKVSFLITTMKREWPYANLSVTDIIKMIGDQTLVYSPNKKVAYQYADPLHPGGIGWSVFYTQKM